MVRIGGVKQFLRDRYFSIYQHARKLYQAVPYVKHPQRTQIAVSTPTLMDCLARTDIILPPSAPRVRRCIATVVSSGFGYLLDDMLGSLNANGACQDALVVVFTVDDAADGELIAAKYQAQVIRCRSRAVVNPTVKSVLYSVARVVNAEQFLCLDADMLVLRDLRPVFSALDACPDNTILVCREGNGRGWHKFDTLGHALSGLYRGCDDDLISLLLGTPNGESAYPLVVNDGLFAGSRTALLALDGFVRVIPNAVSWIDERRDVWWRNQFIFNLALAQLRCAVELDPVYNLQLNAQDVEIQAVGKRIEARWAERPVAVLHFNGPGRGKYPEWRNLFAQVRDPLVRAGGEDSYAQFLTALRSWVGRRGLSVLARSFYGVADGDTAGVSHRSTFSMFAALHYLIHTTGCVRVLETATGRGLSAACLASSVSHRQGAKVVTIDNQVDPEREDFWAMLPPNIRACIETRLIDAAEGLTGALKAGESYHAVLLDSHQKQQRVWAEFLLATQLVKPGGLILIHGALCAGETVGVLRQIEAAGYGVTRLGATAQAIPEDDHLSLTIVENRLRSIEQS
jgi:predicted O-methyltransferase YrrM